MMGVMRRSMAVILLLVLVFSVQGLTAITGGYQFDGVEDVVDQSFDRITRFALNDAAAAEEYYGYTELPVGQPLEIRTSDDPHFEYMAHSPYYTVFFKGTTVRMVVEGKWVECTVTQQELGDVQRADYTVEQNVLSAFDVFESVDVSYTVESSLLREAFILRKAKSFERVVQGISWEGLTPEIEEDGSIVFSDEHEKVLKILPPFMRDAQGDVCTDVHYELVESESGYQLHKVIDEKGVLWLEQAVYPVVIDPSIGTLEDAWKSSGLTPYGQYFQNLKEYVNPANGHLTVTQTDLVIPGRGLDLVISRVYEMPAVFYGMNPYGGDYEAPPVDVGKGWQLDFPYIGDKYLHLWGGTVYKIVWVGTTFENHKGAHFILVKNGDTTYTLTTADGIVYEFDTSGKLTQINDVDLNTITFTYTSGVLTSITDTIGRTVDVSYSSNRLQKITYNGAELEYSYNGNGCLVWMEDFLDRRTRYSYNTGYNDWLLSEIEYVTTGYTTYVYNRFSDGNYYRYYVTDQRVYETGQVRHSAFSYTGSFSEITSTTITVKNESDVTRGSYYFVIDDGVTTEKIVKNASGTPMRKYTYTYNSKNEVTEERVYYDGSTLSYTTYYSYDNWGNCVYYKNAEGHEQVFSYANTDTSGFFVDATGAVIKTFTNAFSTSTVPASVHTGLLGTAEKQDNTYVKEVYLTYDTEAHPTQFENSFGNATTWLTFSGTFNEKTGSTSFPIDLSGHIVAGNAVLQVTGLPSDDTYHECHSTTCPGTGCRTCSWSYFGSGWSGEYYTVHWQCCPHPGEFDEGYTSIGPFIHCPGTLGYLNYSTNPALGQSSLSFAVTTNWKAYPVQVQYNLDNTAWKLVTSNLKNTTVNTPVHITDGSHTLYFSESSSQKTRFSWYLYVPVDSTPDTYTTTMQYDTYGNITSITDAESNTISLTYSSSYSHAYLTEISSTVGTDTITTRATYDSARGWITSIQEPEGVASSGYDYLYTYDLLGRVTKKEFPLLSGQSQRSCLEAVYDDTNRTVTIIDQLRHYIVQEFDTLGRHTSTKWYTGTYGSGTLYAAESYTYHYNDSVKTATDPGNDQYTYTYDFLGRKTQIQYPDSSTVSYSYNDTTYRITRTNGRGYRTIYWYDWVSRLIKVEEEYTINTFASTSYQYDEGGHLTSVTDAETHTTTYMYASLFGLTKTTYPDTEYEEYVYDNVGNLAAFTDCMGNDTTYTYDDIYRLTQIQYEDQSAVSFMYDLNSNRTQMDDNAPNVNDYVEYIYDYWNRLTAEKRHISTHIYTVSYMYDTASRLTTLTYPDSMQILYSYDDLNRTTQIKRYIDGVNDELLMDTVQYNTESLLTQFDYGNGLQASYTYDVRDRLSTVDVIHGATSFLDLDYTYDNTNNITQLVNGWRDTSSTWHTQTESYRYDGLDRLTSASCTLWSHTYSYDRVGNRTGKDSIAYTVNTVNEVTALSDGTSFTYDDNRNRTQKTKGTDTLVYTYDYANRLTKVEENSVILGEYVYDGDGRRIQVTESNDTTTYIYSGLTSLYEENSIGTAVYIYGPTGKLAKRTTINQEPNTFYYLADHLGSTRLVTDESKTIVAALTYQPFGESSTEEGTEDYLFNGKQKDETGLYYYGARYYDSEVGRFLTRDSDLGHPNNPQSMNRYSYCLNNPLKYVDPLGLEVEDKENPEEWEEYFTEEKEEGKSPEDIINDLIELGDYLGALICTLIWLDCAIDSIEYTSVGLGSVHLTINNTSVTINATDYSKEDETLYGEMVKEEFPLQEGDPLVFNIYFPAFKNDGSPSARKLYHVVGHEMQHADHYAECGIYWRWKAKYGAYRASAMSEYLAYQWNLQNYLQMPYKGAIPLVWAERMGEYGKIARSAWAGGRGPEYVSR
jgi:RHS repeat-associated protein